MMLVIIYLVLDPLLPIFTNLDKFYLFCHILTSFYQWAKQFQFGYMLTHFGRSSCMLTNFTNVDPMLTNFTNIDPFWPYRFMFQFQNRLVWFGPTLTLLLFWLVLSNKNGKQLCWNFLNVLFLQYFFSFSIWKLKVRLVEIGKKHKLILKSWLLPAINLTLPTRPRNHCLKQ